MIDHANMLGILDKFPEQCREAAKIARRAKLRFRKITNVVICGSCSDGIAGDIAAALAKKIPIYVANKLPSFADKNTLVVVLTYSGENKEILEAYRAAKRRKAQVVLITSNERLARREKNVILLPAGMLARLSIGYLLFSTVIILQRAKAIPGQNIAGALDMLTPKTCSREGFMISKQLKNKIPLIYATPLFKGIARRLKLMINMNAKIPAFSSTMPEAFYCEISGLKKAMKRYIVLFIYDGEDRQHVKRAIEVFSKLMKKKVGTAELNAKGSSLFAQLLYLIYVCDYISYYLALMNKEDPTPNPLAYDFKEKISGR